jgi:uncharacterized membrane protein YwzB
MRPERGTRKQNPVASTLLTGLCILCVAALLIIFHGGIKVGFSNHVGLLPVVRRFLNPDYLPQDFSIALRFYHHRTFVYLVAALSWILGEDNALITLSVAGKLFLSVALFYLCRVLRIFLPGFLTVGCLLATGVLWTGNGLETNTFIGIPEIEPPIFAHSLVLLGTATLLQRRYRITAFLAGTTLLCHLQIGLIFALLLTPFYVNRIRTFGVKELLRLGLLFFAPASIALLHLYQMMLRGLNSPSFSLSYIDFRQSHHFELLSAQAAIRVIIHLTLLTVVYWRLRRMGQLEESRWMSVLVVMSVMLAVLSAAHFLDYYLLRNGNIIKFQFPRLSSLITVFGALALVTLIKTWAESYGRRAGISWLAHICLSCAVLTWPVYRGRAFRLSQLSKIQRFADEGSDWVKVCQWIGEHGPGETVYLTPPGNEGFTYLSNRSNVVEFKINPDGGQYLSEWYERLKDLSGGRLADEMGFNNESRLNQAFVSLDDRQIKALGKKYRARYAVVPASSPVSFETIYENDGYRVNRLPDN